MSAVRRLTVFSRIIRAILVISATTALVLVAVIWESNAIGPYTRRYNERLYRIATDAKLVGDEEARVLAVLGKPSFVWERRPTGPHTMTGDPLPGAGFVTTYNYAPYGSLWPFSIFQVHVADGKVTSLERYD